MKPIPNESPVPAQTVWYIAAGYKLPAGIEAYLLHYATELRDQGFDPRIIVFEPLPKVPHRFLVALRERKIPIESLYERVGWRARAACVASYLPWLVRATVRKLSSCSVAPLLSERPASPGELSSCSVAQLLSKGPEVSLPSSTQQPDNSTTPLSGPSTQQPDNSTTPLSGPSTQQPNNSTPFRSLQAYWLKRFAVRELKEMIEREHPDIIHVKGRIISEAFAVLPSDRTIYQHALMGTRDPSWTNNEAETFSAFLNRIARVLVQGRRIAETFAHSFQINRLIDVVFTMAPDELAPAARKKLLSCQVAELLSEGPASPGELSSCSVARLLSERPEVSLPSATQHPSNLATGGASPATQQLDNSTTSRVSGATQQPNNSTTGTAPTAVLRFGILCRFTEQKGISYILEALKMFREKYGQVDFTFAGQGPLESVIREACRGDGVTECRSGRGVRIERVKDPSDILKNLDVFVHPGLDDAMPVSIVEALMCGVPCIVSNVGASPELVRDGVEGRVIEPGSSEEIFRAMEWFAALSADELAALKARARQRYEECCTPPRVGAKVAAIYREVIGKCVRRDVERHLKTL